MNPTRPLAIALFAVAAAPGFLVGCTARLTTDGITSGPADLCGRAQVRQIVGTAPDQSDPAPAQSGEPRRCTATRGATSLSVGTVVTVPASHAQQEHRKECTAMAPLGTVRHPSLGDEACVVTENGPVKITTVIVRKGALTIGVRYASPDQDPTQVERTALTVATRISS